nr:laminin subunit alpha-4-like [Salvelinus alpinus]
MLCWWPRGPLLGQSYLDLSPDSIPGLRNNFYAGFGFRTDQKNGLMFYYHQAQDGVCQVFLDKGHVVVRAADSEVKTQKTYNDDNDHYLTLYSNNNGLRLYVDDVLEKAGDTGGGGASSHAVLLPGGVYLGGTPDNSLNNLTGCLSNLFIKRDKPSQMVMNLINAKENVDVPLDCPAAKKPQQILATLPRQKRPKVPGPGGFVGCVRDLELNEESPASPSTSLGVVPCFQTALQPGAYFSSQGGHMAIDESLTLGRNLEVQLEVRPVSDSGLLLHAGSRAGRQLSLYLYQGTVTVTVNSGNGEFYTSFTPEESLCDGRWHSITNGVDVPGLPDALPSFHGCVRRAVLNQRPAMLSKPLSVHGAVGTQGCPAM